MLALAIAVSMLAPSTCPPSDAKAELLSLHETTRQAHLQGDAARLTSTIGDTLLLAEKGAIRTQTNAELRQFFDGYFGRVRYSEWRDAAPPTVTVSPDGQMAWMAVQVEARYALRDKPGAAEKSFKSSWIATFARVDCAWRMTGIASDVAE